MTRTLLLCSLLLSTFSACGGDDDDTGTPIDCTWFAEANCWKETMAAAIACKASDSPGTFNAGRTECSFTDGTKVTFADPVPQSIFDAVWDFDITNGAGTCMSLEELGPTGEDGLSVTTSAGTFRQETVGANMVLTCMDGSKFSIGAFSAISCDLSTLPGYASSGSSGSVSVSLIGDPDASDKMLFTCE